MFDSYEEFYTYMKTYTLTLQSQLKTIISLQSQISIRSGDIFDDDETRIKMYTSHPDELENYIYELEEKLLPYSDYEDEFNEVMDKIKEKCKHTTFRWIHFHPLYKAKISLDIDWETAIKEAKENLETLSTLIN